MQTLSHSVVHPATLSKRPERRLESDIEIVAMTSMSGASDHANAKKPGASELRALLTSRSSAQAQASQRRRRQKAAPPKKTAPSSQKGAAGCPCCTLSHAQLEPDRSPA